MPKRHTNTGDMSVHRHTPTLTDVQKIASTNSKIIINTVPSKIVVTRVIENIFDIRWKSLLLASLAHNKPNE